MRPAPRLVLLALMGAGAIAPAPLARAAETGPTVSLIKMPYRGERNLPDLSDSPDYLEAGGISKLVEQQRCRLRPRANVALGPEDRKAYGEWNRLGLANGQLAHIVAAEVKEGGFPVGLLANCSSIMGMLGGRQHSGPSSRPLRVGLVFIDAHGDFTDVIYVHVDMDVLDPPEVSGHPLTVPGGPTSLELAAALTDMFEHEKAAAFGVASTPSGDQDRDGRSRRAAYNLILGALKGVQQRGGR